MIELIKKLNKIQREMKALKTQTDPSGRFAFRNAESLNEAVKPFLGTDVVLLVKDETVEIGGRLFCKATAALTNGTDKIDTTAYAEIPASIMSMSAPQISGSASSYAKKYALQHLLMTDNNPEIDSHSQFAEELENFAACIADNRAFDLYMLASNMSPEAQVAVWNMYKGEYIAKGEIGQVRATIGELKQKGRDEALKAQAAFLSDDETEVIEAMGEYTLEQQEFINQVKS